MWIFTQNGRIEKSIIDLSKYLKCLANFFILWRCVMFEVLVDKDKCSGDEECVAACPAQVFEMVDGKADPVEADECLGCETCIEVCPEGAITVTEM
jgi:NAD-dependent dihydropyrimidine dehydrogenase PreA subunit